MSAGTVDETPDTANTAVEFGVVINRDEFHNSHVDSDHSFSGVSQGQTAVVVEVRIHSPTTTTPVTATVHIPKSTTPPYFVYPRMGFAR